MIEVIKYPKQSELKGILKRPSADDPDVQHEVSAILHAVKEKGDTALRMFSEQFDGISLSSFTVTEDEWYNAPAPSDKLKAAIDNAIENIRKFHEKQLEPIQKVEVQPGVICWRKSVAIEKIGLYVPGGTAPLFSTLLMLAIPAQIAGCKEIILCTPPGKTGSIDPSILYTAEVLGIKQVFKIGGAQAVAAMAYGTETVSQVYKIFGPGNRYVTAAKMLVNAQGIAIDMPAGPSEVAILADNSCNPAFVAADLLSQAEHGADSQTLLVSTSEKVIEEVQKQIKKQLQQLPRKAIAQESLANSKALLVNSLEEGMDIMNNYAPEHLMLACVETELIAEKVINAGSVFLGSMSPESAGDYASGTNHTLPTNGFAKAYSGVSVDSFVKKITFQQLTQQGLSSLSDTIIEMALAEGLEAHANAVKIRINR